jgi:hypothetical protein
MTLLGELAALMIRIKRIHVCTFTRAYVRTYGDDGSKT